MKKKDIRDSETTKRDKPHREGKPTIRPNPAGAKEISDADLEDLFKKIDALSLGKAAQLVKEYGDRLRLLNSEGMSYR